MKMLGSGLFSPSLLIAFGFGTGLSPYAPGTVATAWAWLSFNVLQPVTPDWLWATILVIGFSRSLGDPSHDRVAPTARSFFDRVGRDPRVLAAFVGIEGFIAAGSACLLFVSIL